MPQLERVSLIKELLLASLFWRYNQVITALWTLGCQAIASEEPLYMLALRLDVQSTSLSALNPRFLGPYILLRPHPVDALLLVPAFGSICSCGSLRPVGSRAVCECGSRSRNPLNAKL